MARPNLVLGMVHQYPWAQIRPFLLSLRQTGYSGDVVLFYHSLDSETMKALRGMGVVLLPFHNLRGSFRRGWRRKALNSLSQWYYQLKPPFYAAGWPWLLSPAKQRFLLFRKFLRAHGDRYQRVLLTDTRDVYFQRDPFADDPGADLIFFEEDHVLAHGMFNPLWIINHLGRPALERLGGRQTLCAGTIMGSPAGLGWLLDQLRILMSQAGRMDFATGDQALLNATVYDRLDSSPFPILLSPNAATSVYTLSRYLDRSRIKQSATGDIVDDQGRAVPILHQYDRHPDLMKSLLERLPPG